MIHIVRSSIPIVVYYILLVHRLLLTHANILHDFDTAAIAILLWWQGGPIERIRTEWILVAVTFKAF